MGKYFYIADWHYGHKNCLAFDNRPFLDVDQMNKSLINRWNQAVSDEDTVFILGDMFWCKTGEAVEVLKQLKGIKILVKGNHDRVHDKELREQFVDIRDYMEIDDHGRKVVLSHYPIPCFKNHYYGWYHCYGHVHSSFEHNMMENVRRQMTDLYDVPCNMFNVGVMMPYMDYAPRTLDELIQSRGE